MRIGFNLQDMMDGRRQYSADEKNTLWNLLPLLNPSAMLVLDNFDWAKQVKRILPNCLTIFRQYRGDDGRLFDTMTPISFYNLMASYADAGLIINVLNEPTGYADSDTLRRQAKWTADVGDLFGRRGFPIVAPDWAVGNPDEKRFDCFKDIWDMLGLYKNLHYLGLHLYWSERGIEYTNGRVGRVNWIGEWLTDNKYTIPNVLATEFGIDSIPGGHGNGWRDSRTEEQYADEIEKVMPMLPSYVHGAMIFSYGNTGSPGSGQDWRTHNTAGAGVLLNRLVQINKKQPTESTVPIAVVPDVITVTPKRSSWVDLVATEKFPLNAKVYSSASFSNIRLTPNGDDIGDVFPGNELSLLADPTVYANGFTWFKCKFGTLIGWIAITTDMKFEISSIQPTFVVIPSNILSLATRLQVQSALDMVNDEIAKLGIIGKNLSDLLKTA